MESSDAPNNGNLREFYSGVGWWCSSKALLFSTHLQVRCVQWNLATCLSCWKMCDLGREIMKYSAMLRHWWVHRVRDKTRRLHKAVHMMMSLLTIATDLWWRLVFRTAVAMEIWWMTRCIEIETELFMITNALKVHRSLWESKNNLVLWSWRGAVNSADYKRSEYLLEFFTNVFVEKREKSMCKFTSTTTVF